MTLFSRLRLGRRAQDALDEKASKTGPLIALHRTGEPVWTPRDYRRLAEQGYARNPIVYRAVRLISEAAASVPWLVYEGGEEVETHPLLDLLRTPNRRQAGVDFMEALYGYLLVSGNAYVEAVAVGGAVRELHALRPDRMKVVPGADGWPEGYDYTVGGETVRFESDAQGSDGAGERAGAGAGAGLGLSPILHLTLFHPLNDHYGFAPIEAAQASLDVHNAAGGWNKALLDNAARPSGALVYSNDTGHNLSDEQFDRLKGELEENFQGARNAGRPMLLEGGLDWRAMSMSPRDMDFIEAKNQAAREIALAFGVPPMLLGIPGDNTYSNYQEANRAFWRQTVLPLTGRVSAALGAWLLPVFGEGLKLDNDLDAVMALAPEREAIWNRLNAASFLTTAEKRVAVGYSAEPKGHTRPADEDRMPAPDPDPAEPPAADGAGAAQPANGAFDPDATRSGAFQPDGPPAGGSDAG